MSYLDSLTKEVKLQTGLAEGKYMLLYIEYEGRYRGIRGTVGKGIGRYLEVAESGIKVTVNYISSYGFGGSGTKEDPYRISCDSDLDMLSCYVNSDGGVRLLKHEYFIQEADIDLRSIPEQAGLMQTVLRMPTRVNKRPTAALILPIYGKLMPQ